VNELDKWYERMVKEGLSLDYRGDYVNVFLRKECYEYDEGCIGVSLSVEDLENIIKGFGKKKGSGR